MNYLIIAGSSVCVYLFIIAALRLFGKKELAQLSVLDLVFILLISNSVQNAMVGADTSLVGGLCAALSLFVANAVLKYIIHRFPKAEKLFQGNPIMLVYQGKLCEKNLKKAGISIGELEEAVREHGVVSINEVNLAVMEMDGNISILSDNYTTASKKKKSAKASEIIKANEQ